MSEIVKKELGLFEDFIEQAIRQAVPQYANIVLNMPMITNKIYEFEDMIEKFMDSETGLVDGKKANEAIKMFKPELANFVALPNKDFRLIELVQQLKTILIGG